MASSSAPLSAALTETEFARLPRTYANALGLLSLLSTNRDVTALFEVARPGRGGAGAAADDLNALAIPEMLAWLARAGYADPARDLAALRCVHIAGTKGKGSVSAFVTAALVAAREEEEAASRSSQIGRIGTYLSPHVVSVRERIWLDGRPISRELFAKYTFDMWERLSQAAEAAAPPPTQAEQPSALPYGPHSKPFYFRFLTLLALHVFVREHVRSAVIECGIGGEYDATNILPAASVTATAITRLGIDHVAMLGRTLDEIAWHKAGIFKPGVAAFTLQSADAHAHAEAAALSRLRARAAEKKALALYEIPAAAVDRWEGISHAALPGPFQKYNMALAAAVARHHLRVVGAPFGDAPSGMGTCLDPAITVSPTLRGAFAKATLRGRCEVVWDGAGSSVEDGDRGGQPVAVPATVEWLVDGAHTSDSLTEVARFFAAKEAEADEKTQTASPTPYRFLLFSVRDRDPSHLARAVIDGAGSAGFFHEACIVFSPENVAARESAVQAIARASPETKCTCWDDVAAALHHVRTRTGISRGHGHADNSLEQAAIQQASPHKYRALATGSFVIARDVLKELDADFEE